MARRLDVAGGGTAVVTGAARGLGLEIARALAGRGWPVHLVDVDEPAVIAAARGLGGGATAGVLDVTDAVACREVAAEVAGRPGGLAVWVSNAGILLTGPAWEHDDDERRRVLDVNVHGVMNGAAAALPHMRRLDRGHVVTVASLAGLTAASGEVLYAASKHAALAWSLGLAADLARSGCRGVFASAVCPDGTVTPMLDAKMDDPEAAMSWSGSLQRPQDVAAAVARVVERPRPVTSVPRWRGTVCRFAAAFPSAAVAATPALLASARRKQEAWARSRREADTLAG